MAFIRKSSLRNHVTAEIVEFFHRQKTQNKTKTTHYHCINSTGKMLLSPMWPMQTHAPNAQILRLFYLEGANQKKIRIAEIRSKDSSKKFFNLPSMKPGRGLEKAYSTIHNWIFHVFGFLCGVGC